MPHQWKFFKQLDMPGNEIACVGEGHDAEYLKNMCLQFGGVAVSSNGSIKDVKRLELLYHPGRIGGIYIMGTGPVGPRRATHNDRYPEYLDDRTLALAQAK